MKKGKTTQRYGDHEELIRRLAVRHQPPEWVFIPNLRVGTGFANPQNPSADQHIDAWAMSLWFTRSYRKVAYEVKVSRADFFKELENPEKRQAALRLSNYFYFAVPAGMVTPLEVPEEAGLLYITAHQVRQIKAAPRRQGPEPSWSFIASVARALSRNRAS